MKKLNAFTIKKTEYNMGFEGNNGRCVQMCEKDYAWMLGDDDTINVKLNEVIKRLEDQNELADFIIVGKNKILKKKNIY